jgi:hypothetical protein
MDLARDDSRTARWTILAEPDGTSPSLSATKTAPLPSGLEPPPRTILEHVRRPELQSTGIGSAVAAWCGGVHDLAHLRFASRLIDGAVVRTAAPCLWRPPRNSASDCSLKVPIFRDCGRVPAEQAATTSANAI